MIPDVPHPFATIPGFAAKVDIRESEVCWPWTGARNRRGYGNFNFEGRWANAHRVAYILANGFTPPSHLEVCHDCDNRACCNPSHLWLGTAKQTAADKMRKGRHQAARQTHCRNGHPLEGENLLVREGGKGRRCRTCREATVKAGHERYTVTRRARTQGGAA